MSLTLGLTGMDPATETALKAAFDDGNARLGGAWRLLPEAEADHVVVDMDSMYGPMSWLRLHAAGRHVIGLTSAPRTQTEFRLGRPFDGGQVAQLLADVARSVGVELTATPSQARAGVAAVQAPDAPAMDAATPDTPAVDAVAPPALAGAEPEAEAEAEADTDADAGVMAEATTMAAAATADAYSPGKHVDPPHEARATADVAVEADAAATDATAEHAPEAAVEAEPAVLDFAAWLRPGALSGRVRYGTVSGPTLLIDADNDCWHGPTPLKPLAGYFEGALEAADFTPVDAAAWAREAAAAGAQQPLARLRWLGGLLAGDGALVAGQDPAGRYALTKWPQTEREYPRHFRIATAMMKGPATVAEIADASGIPAGDVADFINANLATGYAEAVVEAPPVAEEPVKARSGGLLGRLRNR